ncbi:MAG TPA: LptA/OstA family protein [Acetobacteraceae bacterium]|jgi:lipopolysaccharide export system protein LptA|nr:LptA/OstA family protein [Acetobacteraceae bacterium]
MMADRVYRRILHAAALAIMALAPAGSAWAQQLDLAHGGPISITASDGIEWRQEQREVIARGNAQAVRGNVTVTADRLIAYYRPKAGTTAQPTNAAQPTHATQPSHATQSVQPTQSAQSGQDMINGTDDTAGNEIFRLQAEGHVHIFTATDQVWGDRAIYDIDQAVLVVTGHDLKLTTPNDVITARDDLEYWSQKHMAVARGNAVVVTNDGRRLAADTLVAYTAAGAPQPPPGTAPAATPVAATSAQPAADDQLAASGKLQKVDAFGNVSVRTPTDTAIGDRAVYVPDTGIARLAGRVRITRGQNQLNGSEAEVDMKTGISHLLAGNEGRVQGLVLPNDASNQQLTGQAPPSSPTIAPAGSPPARNPPKAPK